MLHSMTLLPQITLAFSSTTSLVTHITCPTQSILILSPWMVNSSGSSILCLPLKYKHLYNHNSSKSSSSTIICPTSIRAFKPRLTSNSNNLKRRRQPRCSSHCTKFSKNTQNWSYNNSNFYSNRWISNKSTINSEEPIKNNKKKKPKYLHRQNILWSRMLHKEQPLRARLLWQTMLVLRRHWWRKRSSLRLSNRCRILTIFQRQSMTISANKLQSRSMQIMSQILIHSQLRK